MFNYKLYYLYGIFAFIFLFLLGGCVQKNNSDLHIAYQADDHALEAASVDIDQGELGSSMEEDIPAGVNEIVLEEMLLEPEQTEAQELQGLENLGAWEEGKPAVEPEEAEIQYDFPITVNRQVEYYLDFFQNKNREIFTRWLARSGAYLPMIQERLEKAGLPRDLAYLAMIESGFSQIAYSRARAVGLWQFIRATARNYGLKVNNYVDERRDPIKSTDAAIAYLSELYAEFDSWYLAVAGYNAGENKIRRAIKKYKTDNFWELAQGRYLKLETKRYVPKLIAAIIIAKNPQKYGFGDVEYEKPLVYDTMEIPRWTALKAIALACEVEVDNLQKLNRELRKPFTPPNSPSYLLKVPAGKKSIATKNLSRIHAVVSTNYKTHVVRRGESLNRVCRKYGLTKTIILKVNNLKSAELKVGQRLRIPYRTTEYQLLPEGSPAPHFLVKNSNGEDFILHKVRPGDTVSDLAKLYRVPTHLIAGWNNLKDISRIRVGQKLAIYVQEGNDPLAVGTSSKQDEGPTGRSTFASVGQSESGGKTDSYPSAAEIPAGADTGKEMFYYRVCRGESLWVIARRFNISLEELRSYNNLENDVIYPGNHLLIAIDAVPQEQPPRLSAEPGEKGTYYQVRWGDSLWTIARKFHLSTEELRRLNNLENDVIYPGNRLLVKKADIDV